MTYRLAIAIALLGAACTAEAPPTAPARLGPPARTASVDAPGLVSPAMRPLFDWTSAPSPAPLALLPGALATEGRADPAGPPSLETRCNEQAPQEFLMRGSYVWQPTATPEERAKRRETHRRAVEYRSRNYGFVEGSGDPAWNHLAPGHLTRDGKFFGIGVRMNNRVLTALGCVEQVIAHECKDAAYAPRVLDGLRTRNTFHNDEVSNHLYGIAIDIDPDKNSCCGCVPPLSEWPRCKKPASSPFERSFVPRCWVDRFERFGFYWLGYDTLEDTMHFEFLGDPARIVKKKT